jgi:Uma2 family endonuclease
MAQIAHPPKPLASVPPLRAGDRLTRDEFERRWELHPEIKKAELIDGLVYTEMTVSRSHGKHHAQLMAPLALYVARTSDIELLDNVTVRLGYNDFQPDALIRRINGGTTTLSKDDCVDGPPELVAEVAASSASYDTHLKKEAYRRGGVREYLVWQVYEERIDWWRLENGDYAALEPDADGIIESREFPGLRLHVPALMSGDLPTVLATIEAKASEGD